jgi:hypothetical protein
MGYFPSARALDLQGNTVRCDLLVMFDFASGAMRLWQGFGTLDTLDGHSWDGIGELGQIGDLESTLAGDAPQATFTLSGVNPAILHEAMNTSAEVYGRDVNVCSLGDPLRLLARCLTGIKIAFIQATRVCLLCQRWLQSLCCGPS